MNGWENPIIAIHGDTKCYENISSRRRIINLNRRCRQERFTADQGINYFHDAHLRIINTPTTEFIVDGQAYQIMALKYH